MAVVKLSSAILHTNLFWYYHQRFFHSHKFIKMKHHFITAGNSINGKKAYRKPVLKSFGKVSKLTKSNKGSTQIDFDTPTVNDALPGS